jgi:hypothetical protein
LHQPLYFKLVLDTCLEAEGGLQASKSDALFLFSSDSNAADTKRYGRTYLSTSSAYTILSRLFKSKEYTNNELRVFTSLLAETFLTAPNPNKVKSNRFLLLPGDTVHEVNDNDNEDVDTIELEASSTQKRGKRAQKVRLEPATDIDLSAKHAKRSTDTRPQADDETELFWLCNGKRMTMQNHLVRDIPIVDKAALFSNQATVFEVVDLKSKRWSVVKIN